MVSAVIDQALLAESLGRLDSGTRALLDLSLRRAIPDDQVAKVLGVNAASIPPRRARGIAQLADMMEIPGPSELAAMLIAIPDLPEEAWGVPVPALPVGGISRARRAKAFRRVAVAASPLVALGAVMAAVLVSSDHSGGGSGFGGARLSASGVGAGAGRAASAAAAEARHGLPQGAQLTFGHPGSAPVRVASARHASHHRRHAAGVAAHTILARGPTEAAPRHSEPVAYHPAPVVPVEPVEPRHVAHHHPPAKPKTPTSTPAPIQTPSQPVSAPSPPVPTTPPVQLASPVTNIPPSPPTPPKPIVPQPSLNPPGDDDDDDDGGGCGDRRPSAVSQGDSEQVSQGDSEQGQSSRGKAWSPPGLFRKHHGHG